MDLMARRRVMLSAGKRSRLPREYQEVAFIRNRSNELLKIPLPNFSGTTVHYETKLKLRSTTGPRVMCQVPNAALGMAINWRITLINNSSSAGRIEIPATLGNTYAIEAWQNGNELFLNVNGDTVSGQTTSQSFSTPYFFVCFGSPLVANFGVYGDYEYFKLYMSTDKSLPLCDLVPCYRKSDIKPGMYDMISETFYTNVNTGGDFEVGPDVN